MLPYRPCVGIMVINRAGLIWVGRRADGKTQDEGHGDWWQMPQGGIDEGEDPARAALRELDEETAIRSVTVIGESRDWLTYDLPPHLVGVAWKGRYRGQRQKWFAMRFTGEDAEVDINPRAGHEREFTTWRWAPLDSLLPAVIPFKRKVYTEIVREFGPLAIPL